MFFKRISRFLFGAISLAIISASVFSYFQESIDLPFVHRGPLHSLTGEDGGDGEVVVVKIDDTTFAHPQVGLKEADVVYIEQVEGGLTRLAAVFSSKIPPRVGPVRSARISDIELLAQYGRVGFAYSGAQRLMLPVIAQANLVDVGANKYGAQFYVNDPSRIAPYAMMLSLPELLAASRERGNTLAQSKAMGWKFGDANSTYIPLKSVHIPWPASSYDAEWSEDEKRWLLTHSGKFNLDENGYRLGPTNLIIQIVSITDSIYKDKVGGVTPFSATVGSGKCYLLRDGGYVPCQWNRPDEESGTTFLDDQGREINFAPGQTWFALTGKEPVFTPSPGEGAPSTATK